MLKLYCDDLRNPEHYLIDGKEWTWAKCVTEAIRILARQDVRVLSLDFDITHARQTESGLWVPITDKEGNNVVCPETFEGVALFARNCPNNLEEVIIHTSSVIGRGKLNKIFMDRPLENLRVLIRPAKEVVK